MPKIEATNIKGGGEIACKAIRLMATVVRVNNNEVEHALKALKRQLLKEGVFKELKRRSSYEKPSERRKRKFAEACKRLRKAKQRY